MPLLRAYFEANGVEPGDLGHERYWCSQGEPSPIPDGWAPLGKGWWGSPVIRERIACVKEELLRQWADDTVVLWGYLVGSGAGASLGPLEAINIPPSERRHASLAPERGDEVRYRGAQYVAVEVRAPEATVMSVPAGAAQPVTPTTESITPIEHSRVGHPTDAEEIAAAFTAIPDDDIQFRQADDLGLPGSEAAH
jgi:hypothetical protein